MKKKKITLIFICISLVFSLISGSVSAAYIGGRYISAKGACVLDFQSGEVLYEYNGYVKRSPASMTKIMSLYCIFSELEKQNISLDTVVPISRRVYDLPVYTDYQCIPLYVGSIYTVDDLLGAVITYSASNALLALVELVSASDAEFVALMNTTCHSLGIDATFYDACGGATNAISPYGMACLARAIIRDYPQILERSSKKYIVFNGLRYYSTNKLYTTYYYEGVDGLKTGTSSTAGACLCATGTRNGNRIITVNMLSASNDYRFKDSRVLLDFGFNYTDNYYLPKLTRSNISTYINGEEIPTLLYSKEKELFPVIVVEQLNNYGFDVVYDEASGVMTVTPNPDKFMHPLPCDATKGTYQDKYGDVRENIVKLIVCNGDKEYEIKRFYTSEGYHVVSADDFGKIFNMQWNPETSSIAINPPYNYPTVVGSILDDICSMPQRFNWQN